MRKTLLFSFFIALILPRFSCRLFAQGAPQGINYQAVVRDNSGNILAGTSITVQDTIANLSMSKTYVETFSVTTNKFGLFNLILGQGTVISGSFPTAAQLGSESYFLAISVNKGSGFQSLGRTQFMSVPYALFAGNSAAGPTGPTGVI